MRGSLVGVSGILCNFVTGSSYAFYARVYSAVSRETETVSGYEVRQIGIEEMGEDFKPYTKEEILGILEDDPESKLW